MSRYSDEKPFPNICIIGAGMSGLCAGVQIKQKLGIDSFTIFDVNTDVGGTWYVNKYPGCGCDVESHLYSLSFDLNPDWTECFSSSDEIQNYMKRVASKYELYPIIRFRTQVKTLVWDEFIRKWKVTIENLDNEKSEPEIAIFDIVARLYVFVYLSERYLEQLIPLMGSRITLENRLKSIRVTWDTFEVTWYTLGFGIINFLSQSGVCEPLGISGDYYKCLTKPHVKLHVNKIVNVAENAIKTENNSSTKVDVLILATGFKVQEYLTPMEIIGIRNENILQTWKQSFPSALFGTITHSAPNHFMLLGPNSFLGHNSAIFTMECQVNYVMNIIREMRRTGFQCITVKAKAEKEYMDELRKNMKSMVWSTGKCDSWYTNSNEDVTALWPLSSFKFWWRTRRVDFSKLQFS